MPLVLTVAEVLREIVSDAAPPVREDVQPRLDHHRRGIYPWVRVITTVVLQEITRLHLDWRCLPGPADSVYATFVGYDEVAHHSGIDDQAAPRWPSAGSTCYFARVERAPHREADRPVDPLVVSAHHGQSKGATFLQRYGLTLWSSIIRSLLPAHLKVHAETADQRRLESPRPAQS